MGALTGKLLPNPLVPGSPDWWTKMSASKVAAALGLSVWESRFSLWHKMAGSLDSPPQTVEQARGHYLEPAIRAWFADQHPEWDVRTTGTWQHSARPWQIASPDGEIWVPPPGSNAIALKTLRLLECKTDAHPDGGPDPEWGEEGTDQIPAGYRAQVMWTMDTIGATTTHVAVLSAYLNFREYRVDYDPDEAADIRERVTKFMDTLPSGKHPRRPDIDAHTATYESIRAMNPLIVDDRVELDEETALRYIAAIDAEVAARNEKRWSTSLVADAMGDLKYATYMGVKIARREQKSGGTPYVKQTGHRPGIQEAEAA
jgi:putative phage-type endonuclease